MNLIGFALDIIKGIREWRRGPYQAHDQYNEDPDYVRRRR